jgi:hypothetical protein
MIREDAKVEAKTIAGVLEKDAECAVGFTWRLKL